MSEAYRFDIVDSGLEKRRREVTADSRSSFNVLPFGHFADGLYDIEAARKIKEKWLSRENLL